MVQANSRYKTQKYTQNYTNLKRQWVEGIFIEIINSAQKDKYVPSFSK